MYSPAKINQRLAEAQKEFLIEPEYHTVAQVDEYEQYLRDKGKYVYDAMGNPESTQSLDEFDRDWMLNEQVLCMCDASYALTRYCYIKNEENIIERFAFRIPQKLIFDIIAELESLDAAIEIILLKARQLGVSTLIELLISLRIIFSYGVNAVLGSADRTKTALMANMLFLCYDKMPVWLRPRWTRRVESDQGMLVFGQNATGVSFQHGAQASGIARGTTPTIYHLSECASFTDPVNQIEASLFKAVHASPNVFGVLESTGEGDKGWWPDTWRHAKSNWKHRRARLCPLFLPWFCGVDIYPTPTWLKMRPVPDDFMPNHDTREHVAKAELYARTDSLLSRYMGPNYRMPRKQQWYWEVEHEQAKAKNIESVFLQEMAGDDEEALQRSAVSAFGHETIAEIETTRVRDYTAWGLSGQSIEEAHEILPEYIDYSPGRERIPVKYQSKSGTMYRWELVPLKFLSTLRETESEDASGVLFVFHHPRPGINYSIGVDTSEGKGEDSTVISVWALGYRGQPDVQVAEFASPYVNHVEAFAFILAIAAYYGMHMDSGQSRWREPYVTIEQVAAVGDTCQIQMQKMGYSNFHRFSRYDSSLRRIAKQKRGQTAKRGWFTYGWSRPLLTGNFVHAAQNNWAQINSPWLIEEMKQWEVHVTSTGKEKLEHAEGSHDDRIFAAAMAIFCPHDMESLADRSKKRTVEPTALPPIDLGPYRGHTVSAAQMAERNQPTLDEVYYGIDSALERFSK